jgi:GNAT superfamily N-acetyltransferase
MNYLADSMNNKIQIRKANESDLADIYLCAEDFIQLIENFQLNFLKKKFFTLIAHYNNILAAVLVAEKKVHRVESLETLLPKTKICLIYVNPSYRKKHIATELLESYIKYQKKEEIASIFIKLPQKYQEGIKFFENKKFQKSGKIKDKIILEHFLWYDFGLRRSDYFSQNLNDVFN